MTPEELAKQLGGSVVENSTQNPDEIAKQFGGSIVDDSSKETETLPNIPFFPDSLIRSVANLALKPLATISEGGAAALTALGESTGIVEKGSVSKVFETARRGIDYPYFGNVKPIGADSQTALIEGSISEGEAITKNVQDLVGTTLEVGSLYFTPLKLANGGILSSPFRYAKAVAPFAAPFAAGIGLQASAKPEVTKEESLGEFAKEAGTAFGGAVAGYALLNTGGNALAWLGGKFLKSETGKQLAGQLSDVATRAKGFVDSLNRKKLGEGLETQYRVMQQEVDQFQTKLVDDALNTFYKETYIDEPLLMETIKGNYSKTAKQFYEQRDSMFSSVLDDTRIISIDSTPIKEADDAINTYIQSLSLAEQGQFFFGREGQNLQTVLGLSSENLTPRQAYQLFRSLPNYRTENPIVDKLVRDKMFAYLQGIKNKLETEAPELLNDFNRAFNFADQVRRNVDDTVVHRIRTSGSARNIVDDVMSGRTPTGEQMSVFMQGFTNDVERNNYSKLILNTIINKARQQSSLEDTAIILGDSLKWIKKARSSTGDTVLNESDLAALEQLHSLSKSDFGTFLKNTQRVGQDAELTPQINEAIDKIADLGRIEKLAKRTNGFRDYSILGEEISKIRSVEQLNAILRILPDDQKLRNTLGSEILRGVATRNSRNIKNPDGSINEEALNEMVSGMLNDIDRIGGANKDEIYHSLFDGVTLKFGELEVPMASYLIDAEQLLIATQSGNLSLANRAISATHLITGMLYTLTGRNVPAVYHLGQFARSSLRKNTAVKAYENIIERVQSETKQTNRLKSFGQAMSKASQETRYPTLIGGFSFDNYLNGAEEILGRPLTDDERKELESDFNNLLSQPGE